MGKLLLQQPKPEPAEVTESSGENEGQEQQEQQQPQEYEDLTSGPIVIKADEVEIRAHKEILNDFFKQTLDSLPDDNKVITLPSRFGPVLELFQGYMYAKPIEIDTDQWKLFCELVVFTSADLDPADDPTADDFEVEEDGDGDGDVPE